jgi:hypothetical protein
MVFLNIHNLSPISLNQCHDRLLRNAIHFYPGDDMLSVDILLSAQSAIQVQRYVGEISLDVKINVQGLGSFVFEPSHALLHQIQLQDVAARSTGSCHSKRE